MLTPKQEKFANLYIELGNASEAYRQSYDAGKMGADTIKNNASVLLKHKGVNDYITITRGKLQEKHNITKESILKGLMSIVEDYNEFKEFAKNPNNIASMKKAEVLAGFASAPSAISAYKQASKMLGFDAPEKIEVDHNVTININKPKD